MLVSGGLPARIARWMHPVATRALVRGCVDRLSSSTTAREGSRFSFCASLRLREATSAVPIVFRCTVTAPD